MTAHQWSEWVYQGMGNSERRCRICGYRQDGMEPDADVPPCTPATLTEEQAVERFLAALRLHLTPEGVVKYLTKQAEHYERGLDGAFS